MTDSQAAQDAAAPESTAPEPAPGPSFLTRLARHGHGVLALACILLWLPGIVSLPALDRDESRFAESSRQMLDSGDYVDIRFGQVPRYKKPAGIYWLQAAATAVSGFGDHSHIWTYRLPSLIGGILAVWLTFWCGSLFSAEAGLVAGLLVAASLLLTAEAGIATTDAVLLAAIMGAQGVLLRVWRAAKENSPPPGVRLLMAGWAALAVGILVKGPVAPAVTAVTVIALLGWDLFELRFAPAPAAPIAAPEETDKKPRKPESKPPAAQSAAEGKQAAQSAAEGKQAKPEARPDAAQPAAPADKPAEPEKESVVPAPPAKKMDWRWLAATRPLYGIALVILITAPWLVAITIQSQGAFFQQSLGGDFAAKLAEGQEGHGAPPGFYLLLSALGLWPAILYVLPGIGLALARRAEPSTRFLLAWAGATWLMMEAVPTKLPNYILPAFPPLAILAALWLLAPKNDQSPSGWRRWLPFIAALQFFIGLVAVIAAPALLLQYYQAGAPEISDNWPLLLAVSMAGLSGLMALIIFLAAHFQKVSRLMALVPALLAALIIYPTLSAYVGPRLDQLWISQRLAALVAKDLRPSDPPLILAGYEEPSLVFALGASVDLTDGRGAAEHGAGKGGLALVADEERPNFLARLAELEANAIAVDDLEGFNYSRGRLTHITLYRVSPLNPGAIPKVQ
ncbi:MAG TPA: glycosyltransferase family 39 protein [Rhizomicrobium sp.]|jgi:4-amino-4-deoxy-L-arabinose transferase-like glycosyltransferase|nr:glycosyltransferase family 39 protein [Rhizomicrobium sp.]